ncbi:MAG: putative nucleotide-diphospho-sugar transferase [archaeon]
MNNLRNKIELMRRKIDLSEPLKDIKKLIGEVKINLIVQYFVCLDKERQKEYDACLKKNIENNHIKKIYLFLEEDINNDLTRNNKIEKVIIKKRMTFSDVFTFANKNLEGEIVAFANADIFFDDSLINLKKFDFDKNNFFMALTRYNLFDDGKMQLMIGSPKYGTYNDLCFQKRFDSDGGPMEWTSQDAWVFKSPVKEELINISNFELGRLHCDGVIIWNAKYVGYNIINPCLDLRAIHVHNLSDNFGCRNLKEINNKAIHGERLPLNAYGYGSDKPFYVKGDENIIKKFPKKLKGSFWGITTFFNPAGYKNKIENYKKFRNSSKKQGLNLLCVELVFEDSKFELKDKDADILIQLRTNSSKSILWQKERLINIGLKHLPKDCDKIVWLDCDIIFDNDNWIKETSELLENYIIVQPYSLAVRLSKDMDISNFDDVRKENTKDTYPSMAYSYINPFIIRNLGLKHGHTGFVWSARKEIIDLVGFYDRCVLFFGDELMAHAFCNIKDNQRFNDYSEEMKEDYLKWAKKVSNLVKGSVYYNNGFIFHLWHGDFKDKLYGKIDNILKKHNFNPNKDIKINKEGVWEWASNKQELHKEIKDYFYLRKEDIKNDNLKLYTYYTPSHEILKNKFFLSSIIDNFDIIIKKFSQECGSAEYLSEGWRKTINNKIDMLIKAIKENWGGFFVFSDVDVQFFGKTKEILLEEVVDKDIVFQRDSPIGFGPDKKGILCTGFFMLRANENTLKLWEEVRKIRFSNPDFIGCQEALNYVISKKYIPGLRWGYLPNSFFSPGIFNGIHGWTWKPGIELNIPDNIVMHHANWTKGVENKIKQLEYVKKIVK